ncbi:lipase family alpha/beta hydrolase [Pseudomonas sp. NPDC089743]|uniref:lipase family alpha/beta hydrolase n=1 Tax=Pseudomonas sp. NPDC089743 TaxID=3364471 RepID=UPI0037F34DC9
MFPALWIESIHGYEPLDIDAYKKASAWSYPVYASGYNWLRSNEESADELAKFIEFVLSDCATRLKLKCSQVILVNHSMGGLVARRCAQKHPEHILGIVHGVQPAIGAATDYRRVRAGWEDLAGRLAIGANAREVTPIFASPGPLQLLPNQLYGNNWLNVSLAFKRHNSTNVATRKEQPLQRNLCQYHFVVALIRPAVS